MVYSLIGTFHTITEISNCLPHPFSLFSFSTRTLEFHGAHDLVMTTFPGLLCIKLVQEVVRLTCAVAWICRWVWLPLHRGVTMEPKFWSGECEQKWWVQILGCALKWRGIPFPFPFLDCAEESHIQGMVKKQERRSLVSWQHGATTLTFDGSSSEGYMWEKKGVIFWDFARSTELN